MLIIAEPLIQVILIALELYVYLVVISAILSWLVAFKVVNTSNRMVYMVGDFLYRITEPALRPIRRILPNLGGIDVSPLVLILVIIFAQKILGNILVSLAG
ncbi:MAG: YggT family protein [Kiloniellales bacterium]